MAKTFMQMAEEAMAAVEGVDPAEVQARLERDPDALIVDVRDSEDVPSTGLAARGVNISLGMLPVKADQELPEEWIDSRLNEMGFTNASYMVGGMEAWKAAGLQTE